MIGPLLWLIHVLTYLDTNAQCLVADDGLLWIGVNMGFSDEDQILMKIYMF